ncbi:hypothetical protein HW555_003668 [Spodoptera exigua]|uniref:BESS domain-containing protein n=1 Tax=Spodoptera exigua TaxID=7107 RepID=A0A835GNX3_SPOEX|nr:hypothetical protein HW555_003668 [Spodoptera exigua]
MLKREAWEQVCYALEPNYGEYSAAEKTNTASQIQKKWKGIRDTFVRELKKSHLKSVNSHKAYTYYDNLSFLKPIYESRIKRDEEDNEISLAADDDVKEDSDDSSSNDMPQAQIVNKNNDNNSRKRKHEDTFFKLLAEHVKNKKMQSVYNDPDRQFLLSLLPDFKSVDASVKFDLKYEIMSVIKRFKAFQ